MKERREAGLCFNCDEKWIRGHKCATSTLYIVMTDAEAEAYNNTLQETPDISENDVNDTGEISINALAGSVNCNTLKFKGEFEKHSLCILVDTGSTHSFIDEETAHRVGCKFVQAPPMLINVADGGTDRKSTRLNSSHAQ